jgi:hypothetical protein
MKCNECIDYSYRSGFEYLSPVLAVCQFHKNAEFKNDNSI